MYGEEKKNFVLGRLEPARQAQLTNQGRTPYICTIWVPIRETTHVERGGACWLFQLRWMGTKRVKMKGVLPWLVSWACRAGTWYFWSALAALVGPVQNIFFFPLHYFNSFVPIAHQAGHAAVPGRLSLSMCLWPPFTTVSTVCRGHHSLVSLASAIKASLGVISCTCICQILCTKTIRQQQQKQTGQSQDPTIQSSSSMLSALGALGSRGVVKRSPLELFLSLVPPMSIVPVWSKYLLGNYCRKEFADIW